jgi:hypothetical protein
MRPFFKSNVTASCNISRLKWIESQNAVRRLGNVAERGSASGIIISPSLAMIKRE